MLSIEERLRDAVRDNYDAAEVRIPTDPDSISYGKDEFGCYWVTAQVAVSPLDLDPNPNPVYSVWECEDFSEAGDWSDVSDWRLDELYQCDNDDETGSAARRWAHDRAKYLRNEPPVPPFSQRKPVKSSMVYAVRPGNQPPRLLPAPRPVKAGDAQ
jgi:hypothetical protein